MVLIRQSKGAKIILHARSPSFRAAKLKGFTVLISDIGVDVCLLVLVAGCDE